MPVLSFERLKVAFMGFTLQAALEHALSFENANFTDVHHILFIMSAEGTLGTLKYMVICCLSGS